MATVSVVRVAAVVALEMTPVILTRIGYTVLVIPMVLTLMVLTLMGVVITVVLVGTAALVSAAATVRMLGERRDSEDEKAENQSE